MAERCGRIRPPTPNRGKHMLDNLPATSAPARTLAEFACGLTFEHIPAAVLERAKLLILDALGCGIASNAYGFSDAVLAGATALGGVGRCSVIGRANRLPVRDAALVNGMLIHGLDFDDTHLASIIHATAACLPTALTFGEEQKPTMVDADDLPPKRLECLTRPAPRRGYRAGSAARSGAVLSRRSMASADHLNLKFSRLSLLID